MSNDTLPSELNLERLRQFIAASGCEYATIGFADFQGTIRGKYVSREKLLGALNSFAIPLITLALDPTDAILDSATIGRMGLGFPDLPVRLLPETARLVPWEKPGRNLLVLAEYCGSAEAFCPRAAYRRVFERARALGFLPDHGFELEFTLFDETSQSALAKDYRNLNLATHSRTYYSLVRQGTQAEFYNELMDACAKLRIQLESLHEEMGGGFMEAALRHTVGIDAADQAALFRTFAKTLAQRRGQLMTFMARWSEQADGQSGHVHMSLRKPDGSSAFYEQGGEPGRTMLHFIGGLQRLLPDFLLLCAPNINSFKRFVPGIFAPIAAYWGIENRTCAIRAIPGSPMASRIECRVPGADTNPYLAAAAILAAGIYGIEHEIDPTAPCIDNAYERPVPAELAFPGSFVEGIRRLSSSAVAREFFGDTFIDAYVETRASQQRQFNAMVTDQELRRFFELV